MILFNKIKLVQVTRNFCTTKSQDFIVHNEKNGCGIVQLNRPRSLNAINKEMFK